MQASLSITNSRSLFKLMSFKSVMLSNHPILCHPLLLPPSIFSNIRVFSNESILHIRWPKYLNFSFSISPSNEWEVSPLNSKVMLTCLIFPQSLVWKLACSPILAERMWRELCGLWRMLLLAQLGQHTQVTISLLPLEVAVHGKRPRLATGSEHL